MCIDPIRMNNVLHHLRTKLTWEQIMNEYNNYRPRYRKELIESTTFEELISFSTVFKFTKTDLISCRNELNKYVRNFQDLFYDETKEGIFLKMKQCLEQYNITSNTAYPFINWIPQFGGILQENNFNDEQLKYMHDNEIQCILSRKVPDLPWSYKYKENEPEIMTNEQEIDPEDL